MGHKPWDRPWKRQEKAKAKRAWEAEADEVLRGLSRTQADVEALTDETRAGFAALTQQAHQVLHLVSDG